MATPRTSTSLDPGRAALWRRGRAPLAIAALVLLAALGLALAASGQRAGTLDPRAADRSGSKAVAEVLRDQGVQVDLVQTTDAAVAAAGEGSTLLVAVPDLLVSAQLDRLRSSRADLVLVTPRDAALSALAPGVRLQDVDERDERAPACGYAVAQRAGSADVGGAAYEAKRSGDDTVHLCYPKGDTASLVRLERGDGRSVTVLGSPRILANARLGQHGNAALALGVLGENPRLVWYLPSLSDVPSGGQQTLTSLLPRGIAFAALQLLLAFGVLALWRGRRLGPVVAEPLPVVVRAAEAVEGRARLYRKVGARDAAAAALRRATVTRLSSSLGLARRTSPEQLVAAVTARTGRPGPEVGGLLYGAAPSDDNGLVALADALDRVEREVRRS